MLNLTIHALAAHGAHQARLVVIPIGLELLQVLRGLRLQMSAGSIATLVLTSVLGPFALGVAAQAGLPSIAKRLTGPIAT